MDIATALDAADVHTVRHQTIQKPLRQADVCHL